MTRIILIVSVLFCSFVSVAQNDPTPKFESLKLNSSPAFILLGVEPENLQRPSSPKEFMAGIQNTIVNQKLKPNVAFEVTPYYWKNPDKDPDRFKPEKFLLRNKSAFRSIAETFSLSIGTSESDTVVFGKLKPGTGLGMGIRFTIIDGSPSRPNLNRLVEWNKHNYRVAILSSIYGKMITDQVSKENAVRSAIEDANEQFKKQDEESLYSVATPQDLTDVSLSIRMDLINKMNLPDSLFVQELVKLFNETNNKQTAVLAEINKEKVPFAKNGFMLEFAAGNASVFQQNKWDSVAYAKTAIWLTPSYRWQRNHDGAAIELLDLIGVVRYTINNKQDSIDAANYFDAGIKGQYTHNRWSFSIEGVLRWASTIPDGLKKKQTYRLVSSLDYKFSELVTFKFSFGTNFDGNTTTYTKPKEMFAVGGLNFGIFNKN